ncbi:MAG: hypothetical protein WB562_15270, partial [Candidatus Sulfotelmatobacter sp.]
MYWYEFVLIYFVSGILLIGVHGLYPIIPPQNWRGWALICIAMVVLVAAWWVILRPYETFEYPLDAAQKNQLFYAVVINIPIGHEFFGYLLGWKED